MAVAVRASHERHLAAVCDSIHVVGAGGSHGAGHYAAAIGAIQEILEYK